MHGNLYYFLLWLSFMTKLTIYVQVQLFSAYTLGSTKITGQVFPMYLKIEEDILTQHSNLISANNWFRPFFLEGSKSRYQRNTISKSAKSYEILKIWILCLVLQQILSQVQILTNTGLPNILGWGSLSCSNFQIVIAIIRNDLLAFHFYRVLFIQ